MIDSEIWAVILAAGNAKRMSQGNKLLLEFRSSTILETVVTAVENAGVSNIRAVTGFQRELVEALVQTRATFVHNAEWDIGIGNSIAAGVRSLPDTATGIVIVLGDMPNIRSETLKKIITRTTGIAICKFNDVISPPTCFSSKYRPQLESLTGDTGAMSILRKHLDDVAYVEVEEPSELSDIDTDATYEKSKSPE